MVEEAGAEVAESVSSVVLMSEVEASEAVPVAEAPGLAVMLKVPTSKPPAEQAC